MSKTLSIVFLVIGVVLLIYGINASNSVSSTVTQAVRGTPTDRSIWFIVLGIIGIVGGGLGMFIKRES